MRKIREAEKIIIIIINANSLSDKLFFLIFFQCKTLVTQYFHTAPTFPLNYPLPIVAN